VRELGRLDPAAIEQVRREAWPLVRDADELHDALLSMVALPAEEGTAWRPWFEQLIAQARAATVNRPASGGRQPAEEATGLLPQPADAGRSPQSPLTPTLSPQRRGSWWIAAERWPIVRSALGDVAAQPALTLPAALDGDVLPSDAVVALVRGRMEVCGPTTAGQLAALFGLRETAVQAALEALEGQGSVLRGEFSDEWRVTSDESPSAGVPVAVSSLSLATRHSSLVTPQWCDRRLLARIHRLTLDAARRQVEPVDPEVFLKFLCEYQHAAAGSQVFDRGGLRDVVAQLQGLQIPGGAWERDILPSRVGNYDQAWLDELALSGELAWGRLLPPRRDETLPAASAGVTRVMPLALVQRGDLPWLLPPDRTAADGQARGNARLVYEALAAHGALFFDDLLLATGLLPAQLEDALSELAALGAVTSDGFATMRMLVTPDLRRKAASRGGRRKSHKSYQRGGRWSRFPAVPVAVQAFVGVQASACESPHKLPPSARRAEQWAQQLLHRYGVMFRDLLTHEDLAPAWGELVTIYRRWEAQGRVRGGRFVSGVGGEQYALPEAVDRLRRCRDESRTDFQSVQPDGQSILQRCVILSAADPLNLVGVVTAGPRIPALASAAIALLEGRLVASYQCGEVQFHAPLEPEQQVELGRAIRISAAARMLPLAAEREQRRLQRWQRPAEQARETARGLFQP
jgi:ATP-dependent Lhr-like helicase